MRIILLLFVVSSILLFIGCTGDTEEAKPIHFMPNNSKDLLKPNKPLLIVKEPFNIEKFSERNPKEWGEQVTGVKERFVTREKEIALTFDACGGPGSDGYDEELIEFLRTEKVPATLFINEQWIHANMELFLELSEDPLFQIENHGTLHKPLSVNGGEAWGISATNSPEEVVTEVMTNHETVERLTGKQMSLFRSGTAFYDEVAVEIAEDLGYQVVNFDVLGDAGATFSSQQVEHALLKATPGSIALLHMNQPASGTAAGVKAAVPKLTEQGYRFVLLKERELE